jgi:hypothetical protein
MSENYGCLTIIIIIALMLFIIGSFNSCTSEDWNSGECPNCEVRYELRAISSDYIKYYACPECGKEVKRW